MVYPARLEPDELGVRALEVVETKGWGRWSLRDVARSLGVSANALYRYVDGKSGLEIAIAEAATRELLKALRRINGSNTTRALEFARCYVRFATDRPDAFAAFVHAKPAPDHPKIATWNALWIECLRLFAQLVPDAPEAAGFAFWALVHGRAELARGPAAMAAPTAGLDKAVEALIEGYRSLSPVPSPLPAHVPSLPKG